jgi:hypothetical protein
MDTARAVDQLPMRLSPRGRGVRLKAEGRYSVGLNKENDVLLDLGIEVRYVVLTPERAADLASSLLKFAKQSPKFPREQ